MLSDVVTDLQYNEQECHEGSAQCKVVRLQGKSRQKDQNSKDVETLTHP